MSSGEEQLSGHLDRRVRAYAFLIPVAIGVYSIFGLLIDLLITGVVTTANLATALVPWLLVGPAAALLYLRFTRRALAPFAELNRAVRIATANADSAPSVIPVDGWGEIGELGTAIRAMLAARAQAEQSHDALLTALTHGPVGVIQTDTEGRVIFANAAVSAIMGWPAAPSLRGKQLHEIDPRIGALANEESNRRVDAGERVSGHIPFDRDGTPAVVDYVSVPVDGIGGRSFVTFVTDASAAAQRDLVLTALDRSPVAVMTSVWATSEITGANAAWRAMMGIAADEPIVGRRIGDHDPVSTRYVKSEVAELVSGGVWTGTTTIHRPDGSSIAADGVIVRLADAGDRVVEFWIDRSGERQRDLLMSAVETSSLAMLVTPWGEDLVLAANDAWKRLMGLDPGIDVVGAQLTSFDAISTGDVLAQVSRLAPGESWSGTTEVYRADGSVATAVGIVSRLGDAGDRAVGFWLDRSGFAERDALFEALRQSTLAVVLVDEPKRVVIDANDAWKRLVGVDVTAPAAGINLNELDRTTTSSIGAELAAIARTGGRTWSGRSTITRPDGSQVPTEGLLVGMGPDADPFRRVFGIWTDRRGEAERDVLLDAFNRSSIGVVHVDREQRILGVNAAWERMSGFPAAAVLGRHAGEIDREADAAAAAARLRARASGETQEVSSFLTRADGRRLAIKGWVVELGGGEAFGFWIDRSAEEERDALVEALRASSIGVVHVDAQATMLSVNEAWSAMTGMPAASVIGRSAYEIDPGAMVIVDAARARMTAAGETTWTGTSILTRVDGTQFPVEGRLVDLPSGGSVGLWIDRSAELERDHIMRALETGPVGLVIIDEATDQVLTVNQAWCDITGYADPSVVIGRNAAEVDPDAGRQMGTAFEDRAKGIPWHGTIQMRRADGSSVLAEGYSISTRIPGHGPALSVNFWLDRSAEAQLGRLTEIVRTAPLGIAELDSAGRITTANDVWGNLGGWTLAQALGGTKGGRILGGYAAARSARIPWSDTITVMHPTAGQRPALLTVVPVGAAVEGRAVVFLSDRAEASAALAELTRIRSEFDRLMFAVAASRLVAFYRTSPGPGGHYEWVSGAHERITGFTPEALLRRTPAEVDPDYVRDIAGKIPPSFIPGVTISGTGRTLHSDGRRVPIQFEVVPLPGHGGAISFVVDRTTEVALEEQLRAIATAEAGLPDLRATVIAMLAAIDLALREPGLPREVRDDLRALRVSTERAAVLLEGVRHS